MAAGARKALHVQGFVVTSLRAGCKENDVCTQAVLLSDSYYYPGYYGSTEPCYCRSDQGYDAEDTDSQCKSDVCAQTS